MARSVLLIVLMYGSIISFGQNISVTFTGAGAANQVDSVTAINLTTNQSVTLPGNETLILEANSGIPSISEIADVGIVYPNPFAGTAALSVSISKPQMVYVMIYNLFGQMVAQSKDFVPPGENQFALTVNSAGLYMVSLTSEQGTESYKVICTEATDAVNRIHYLGIGFHNPPHAEFKSSQTGYTLGYTSGEIILYKCYGGIYTTIITDSPADSKNYEVEFVVCTDPHGKDYSVVKIGDQYWMAENLAYLPAVSPADLLSDTSGVYYVYGYNGFNVGIAKATSNYITYGAFYNFPAAKTACPVGWHLPTDSEWQILEIYLGMSETDANTEGRRMSGTVGLKLKESGSAHWLNPFYSCTNSSGFTALPAGIPCYWGAFDGLGHYSHFWTASEGGCCAISRGLDKNSSGVGRKGSLRWQGYSVRCVKNN